MASSVVKIEKALFRAVGAHKPIFQKPIDLELRPQHKWAVTGPRKTELLEIIAAKHVSEPPLGRAYPFLHQSCWPSQVIELIEFSNAPVKAPHLSARYESLREEFDYTVKEMFRRVTLDEKLIETVIEKFHLNGLADRWIVGLSNGQSRRARIAQALLRQPKLLIIDEPLVGLDPSNRKLTSSILRTLDTDPFVVLGLRLQDPFPKWITHVAITDDQGIVKQGPVEDLALYIETLRDQYFEQQRKNMAEYQKRQEQRRWSLKTTQSTSPLIHMKGVSVSYKSKPVLQDVTWKVMPGEKWHLRGDNGTGKSTLLALITADHPQSWNSNIEIFGESRDTGKQSYFSINERIGHASPEIHAIFPMHLTAEQALATGYVVGSNIPPKDLSADQQIRISELLSYFDITPNVPLNELSVGDQKVVMFMRAIVKKPDILILDEALSAMSEENIEKCKVMIEQFEGAVLTVGHIQQEVPFCDKYIRLSPEGVQLGQVELVH